MTLSLDTWVSLGALLGVLVTLVAVIRSGDERTDRRIDRLEAKVDGLRSELTGDIDGLRTELKGDIGDLRTELKGDIARLDDRVYALAAGLRPLVEQAQGAGPVA